MCLFVHPPFVPFKESMQQEIDSVIGRKRCPYMEDRKSLPFTDAVLHEIQRFLDIVPMNMPHYTLKDVSFRGYTIPKVQLQLPPANARWMQHVHTTLCLDRTPSSSPCCTLC